jgi:hypothetical protein
LLLKKYVTQDLNSVLAIDAVVVRVCVNIQWRKTRSKSVQREQDAEV